MSADWLVFGATAAQAILVGGGVIYAARQLRDSKRLGQLEYAPSVVVALELDRGGEP